MHESELFGRWKDRPDGGGKGSRGGSVVLGQVNRSFSQGLPHSHASLCGLPL